MENINDLVVILLCKFIHLLQASTQFVVKSWTPECIKSVLQFASQIENLVSKLSQDEILVLQDFLRHLNTIFLHLSSSITSLHLLNAADCIIELPQFNKYPPEFHLIPEELLMIIECRLFGSHIISLKTITEVETFLDSCFAMDNLYTVHLLIRVLEQSEQSGESDTLRTTIITWLFVAIQKDREAYTSLASYNPDRLRDLTLQIPDF
nr:SJCHGC02202 protein [Schistosoma japonicum]